AEHLRVHHRDRIGRIEAGERPVRRLGVQLETARERGRQPPEEQVRVRHGRPRPTAAVTGRPGIRAGALGPDAYGAATVAPDDRTAARPDGVQVDRGQPQREAPDYARRGTPDAAVDDERDVG